MLYIRLLHIINPTAFTATKGSQTTMENNNTIETKYFSFISFFSKKKDNGYKVGIRHLVTKNGEPFKVLRLIGEKDTIDLSFSSKLKELKGGTGSLEDKDLLQYLQGNKAELQVQLSQAKDGDGNPIFFSKGEKKGKPCPCYIICKDNYTWKDTTEVSFDDIL